MKVLVMGAGVVGVSTAYQLLKDGHEVVVVERSGEAAADTSFANAGLIAPGHSFAWASPKVPKILLKSLYDDRQAFRFRPRLDWRMWMWTLKFLGQCTAERARANTLNKHRLCVYSEEVLHQVVAETAIDYDRVTGGNLYIYRSQATLDRGAANMAILAEDGQEVEVVDRDRVAELDPAFGPVKDKFAGAVYCPTDESGDCRKFTVALAVHCGKLGADFRFGTEIKAIETAGDRITGVVTDQGRLSADAYVLALGCHSPFVATPLGIRLAIYPVKGYSVTIPLDGANNPPRLGGVDEDNLVAYARMGDRIRITATAEFAGYDTSHRRSDFRAMLAAARDLLPQAGDWDRPSYWAGLRPMTPEGTPYIGPTKYGNLYLNAGHGHMGWTMSHGSARIAADLIAGRRPEIDLAGLTWPR